MGDGCLLALETSTGTASVALLTMDGGLLAELSFRAQRSMASRLMPALAALLERVDLRPADLAALAVGLGPGSFTSLRVGLATLKGIALGTELPVVGIGSLEALAVGAPLTARCPVAAVIPAPKRHVYAALYARLDATESNCLFGPDLVPVEALAARIREAGTEVAVCGVLAEADRALLEEAGATALPAVFGVPRAACVGHLALARLHRGERDDPALLTPLYVRPSEAEERLGRAFARSGPPGADAGR